MTGRGRRTWLLGLVVVASLAALAVRAVASVPAGLRGVVEAVEVRHDPDNVLQGHVGLRTSDEATVTLRLAGDGHTLTVAGTEVATRHEVPLLQLRPDTDYEMTAEVLDEDGTSLGSGGLGTFTTGALPDDLPPVDVVAADPSRAGLTLFNSIYRGPAVGDGDGHGDVGYLQAVDASGTVVWYHRTAGGVQDAIQLDDGDLLYGIDEVAVRRITPTGDPLHEWRGYASGSASDEVGDGLAPGEVTRLPVHSLHHEISELPDGTWVSLSRTDREVVFDEPLCDESQPGEPELVVGDAVVVFDPATGEVLAEHDLFDVMSPFDDERREAGDWCSAGYLDPQYPDGADPRDWTHANAVVPIDDGRTWLLSLRHVDALVALRAVDEPEGPAGSLRWTMGVDSDDFAMQGDGRWFWHQHAPELQDDGTLLVYDNGNLRDDAPAPYSRAVRYAFDVDAGTIEQVWEHRMEPDVYASFVGDADRADLDGTVLVNHGGQLSPCESPDATEDTDQRIHTDLLEVDEDTGEPVLHLVTEDDEDCEGWGAYRAERIPTLYPPEYEVTSELDAD